MRLSRLKGEGAVWRGAEKTSRISVSNGGTGLQTLGYVSRVGYLVDARFTGAKRTPLNSPEAAVERQ